MAGLEVRRKAKERRYMYAAINITGDLAYCSTNKDSMGESS